MLSSSNRFFPRHQASGSLGQSDEKEEVNGRSKENGSASSQHSSSSAKNKMDAVTDSDEESSSYNGFHHRKKAIPFGRKFRGNGKSRPRKKPRRLIAEKISLKAEKQAEDLYAEFEESFDSYVQAYEEKNDRSKLTALTAGLKEHLNNNQANELHDVACSLGPANDTDPENVQQHKEKIRLASYCMGQALPSTKNERYKSLFLYATLGTTHSDPQKWGVWKIVFFTAIITLLGILLLTGVFSIAYAIIHIGTNVASTMNIWHLFQAGWSGMVPYQSWIPLSYGFFSSLITGYLFGKTKIEKKISRLEKEIHPNEQSQNSTSHDLDQLRSLKLLDSAIDQIEETSLKETLRQLYHSLDEDHAECNNKGIAFKHYLDSIIFTTTAFARSVVAHQKNPSPLAYKKKNLLFDAVIGASLAQRPNQSWLLTTVTPWLPALIVMALFFIVLTPAVFIGYISLNGLLLASPVFSFISLLPYPETESTLSNKIKNYFIPNKIQKTVFSIEKILLKSPQPDVIASSSTSIRRQLLQSGGQVLSSSSENKISTNSESNRLTKSSHTPEHTKDNSHSPTTETFDRSRRSKRGRGQ